MKTNICVLHWFAQVAVRHLPPGAAIITTASIQAYEPSPILLDYAASKAGIVAYTKALAKQVIEKGIRQRGGSGAILDRAAAQGRPARPTG